MFSGLENITIDEACDTLLPEPLSEPTITIEKQEVMDIEGPLLNSTIEIVPTPVTTISTSPYQKQTMAFSNQTFPPNVNIIGKNIAPSTSILKGNQASYNTPNNISNTDQILTKTRLQELVKQIDPCEQLDEEVEEMLIQFVDEFVTSTVESACLFAKHRNANTVEVKDVQLFLENTYNMWIPGFGTDELKQYRKPATIEAHKQRLALIRKSLRKY